MPWRSPEWGRGPQPAILTRQPSHTEAESREGGREDASSELWEPRHSYSEAPSGTHQKSRSRVTDTSFHQAVFAPTAEWQRGCSISPGLGAAAEAERRRAGSRISFCFFNRDMRKALILISLPHMGFKNDLFFLPKSVWQNVSLCISPPFCLYKSEDFVKPDRGEADFCLILKISGSLFSVLPVRLSISVNISIQSTWYSVLIKMRLGLEGFLFVYVKQQTGCEDSGSCQWAWPGSLVDSQAVGRVPGREAQPCSWKWLSACKAKPGKIVKSVVNLLCLLIDSELLRVEILQEKIKTTASKLLSSSQFKTLSVSFNILGRKCHLHQGSVSFLKGSFSLFQHWNPKSP